MKILETTREQKLQRIIESERFLNKIQDSDMLLEYLLTESRDITNADAGSIYVYENGLLTIKYTQNNTLQKAIELGQKKPSSFFSFEVNEESLAGYSVVSGEILNISDVYHIPDEKPYRFNKHSDLLTGYKTTSVLTIPLISANNETLGVLQIINPLDENGQVLEFDSDAELYLKHFATNATIALEHTRLTRAMIMRMINMARIHDPNETGAHVNRVSSYAVEIYDRWAYLHNIPENEKIKFRDTLKIAAMLHDVGKVGVSDSILKLPRRFSPEEYNIMKTHSYIGATLFSSLESSIDAMAFDVVLHHHARWDGKGYPGIIDFSNASIDEIDSIIDGIPLKGEEIPLAARIVALADVYDALSSKRVYKAAWDNSEVLEEIKLQAGKQFDPEVVIAFMDILPIIDSIRTAWST